MVFGVVIGLGAALALSLALVALVAALARGPAGVALGLVGDPDVAALAADLDALVGEPVDPVARRAAAAGLALVMCDADLLDGKILAVWTRVPNVIVDVEIAPAGAGEPARVSRVDVSEDQVTAGCW